jgi:4-amino-4-deoxy-L-arabinose transferase-like glycosyltransferase
MQSINSNTFQVIAVIFFAFFIRVFWVFMIAPYFPNALGGADWLLADKLQGNSILDEVSPDFNQIYDPAARNLLLGNGFADADGNLTAYVGPGYSAVLAIIYSIFGYSLLPIRLIQILLDLVTCYAVGSIAVKLISANFRLPSMIIYALYPLAFYQTGIVVTETLCTFAVAVSMMFYLKGVTIREDNGVFLTPIALAFLFSGLFLGFSALVRPNTLPLLIPMSLYLFHNGVNSKSLKNLFLFNIGVSIFVITWIIRNYLIFDSFIPISSIIYSTYADLDGSIQSSMLELFYKKINILFADPFGEINFLFSRFVSVWFDTSSGELDFYVGLLQAPFVIFSFAGLFMLKKNSKTILSFFCILFFIITIVYLSKNALARYTVPIVPIMIPYLLYFIKTSLAKAKILEKV